MLVFKRFDEDKLTQTGLLCLPASLVQSAVEAASVYLFIFDFL
ncbi:hypothetical protein STRDD11_00482 [Streptococcus sp. DD11]|nr:hypothetical protein STRDD11_00482 [Streptococcus sp. DD11]